MTTVNEIPSDIEKLVEKMANRENEIKAKWEVRKSKVEDQVNELYKDLTPFQIRDIVIQTCEAIVDDQIKIVGVYSRHGELVEINSYEIPKENFKEESLLGVVEETSSYRGLSRDEDLLTNVTYDESELVERYRELS